ncbi:MAG: InlB B-repeat-containing protein [Coprobacillus sp.]
MKKSVKKKIFVLILSLAMCLQFIGVGTHAVNAASKTDISTKNVIDSTDVTEKIKVEISGVKGETEASVDLGVIVAPKYTGYTFVNATVDGDVINYIGTYKGDKYYANTDISDSATYLLGDSKVKLNYTKEVSVYNIKYTYDAKLLNVVGEKTANAETNLKFRVENKDHTNYQIDSVTANDKLLTINEDGYYVIDNIQNDIDVIITVSKITQYNVTYNGTNLISAKFIGSKTVESNKQWEGVIFSKYLNGSSGPGTLNSIVLNGVYLNIPKGNKKNETKTTNIPGTGIVSVNLLKGTSDYGKGYTYTITVQDVKSDLHFVPALYLNENDIAISSLSGLSVYYWTGKDLRALEVGDMIEKDPKTAVFFVKTKLGYEAVKASGTGTKIIERINDVDEIKNVLGGYSDAKAAAEAKGCNYVMYYSDSSVEHRIVELSSRLIDYTVKYDLNGAQSEAIIDNQKYNIENNKIITVSKETPIKDGFTFTGWKNKETGIIYKSGNEILLNEKLLNALKTNEIKLVAQWVKNDEVKTSSYQIHYFFEQENGTFIENKSLRKTINDAYINKTVFLNETHLNPIGIYEFDESNKNNVMTTVVLSSNQTIPLKAYYVIAKRTLSYDKGTALTGEVPQEKTYLKDTNAIISANTGNLVGPYTDKNDSYFVCWKSDSVYYLVGSEVKMSSNLKLVPVFAGDLKNDTTLNFTTDGNGTIVGRNQFVTPSTYSFGKVILSEAELPQVNANKGYKFDGWYDAQTSNKPVKIASSSTELYNYIKNLTATTTIEAKFIRDETQTHSLSYNVEYYKGDTLTEALNSNVAFTEKVSDDKAWAGDTTLALKYNHEKFEGYIVELTDPKILPERVENGSTVKIYNTRDMSKWTTIKFIAGQGLLNDQDKDFETNKVLIGKTFDSQKITYPNVTAKSGWIFNGWDVKFDKETIITKDMIITALYLEDKNKDGIPDKDQYVTVTFDAGTYGNYKGQQTVKTEKMLPGDKINIPELTVDDGYYFTRYNNEVVEFVPMGLDVMELKYIALYDLILVTPIIPEVPVIPTLPVAPIITPPARVAPVIPVVPVVPAAPAVDNPVVIAPNEVPQGNADNVTDENKTIIDNQVPQAKIDGTWALINLISAIATVIVAAILFILKSKKDEESSSKLDLIIKVIGIIIAVASVIIFFVTEDMSLKMAMSDKWTFAMLGLLVVEVILAVFKKTRD